MKQIQLQFWDKNSPYYIPWIYDVSSVKVGQEILIKNDKQKINRYINKLSDLIIGCLANYSINIMESPDFVKFTQTEVNWPKFTKKSFNSIPFFKFEVIDIYQNSEGEDILVLKPINMENDYQNGIRL